MFLPFFLLIYFLLPSKFRNQWILLGSLLYYAYGVREAPLALVPLLALTLGTYYTGRALASHRQKKSLLLPISLGLIILVLITFKYGGLLTGETLLLPLGLSFYSFQLMGYLLDVSRGETAAADDILSFFTAILFFPKLISGPITPYKSLDSQLRFRSFQWKRFDYGLRDFLFGLALKVLLADQLGGLWREIETIGFASISTPLAYLGGLTFSLQLYFDFWGYSLMAIGIGRMLAFRLPKNFAQPYASRSVSEFWRRWHMTLGQWFTKYLYIPLGGSRCSRLRNLLNLLVVWLITGLWHGSTPNFLLWALYLFVFILLERYVIGAFLERHKFISHAYLLFVIMLSWLIFAITDLSQLAEYAARLFPLGGDFGDVSDFLRLGEEFGLLLVVSVFAATPYFLRKWDKLRQTKWATIALLLLFWWVVYVLSVGQNDPFLYFRF